MRTLLHRSAIALAILASAHCSEVPATPAVLASNLTLSNLQASQLGLFHDVCSTTEFHYEAFDELKFDIRGAAAANLVGASLFADREDGSSWMIGTVAQCASSVTPCSAAHGSVCLVNQADDQSGVRVYAKVPWTPRQAWNIRIRTPTGSSNTLSAVIDRPDNLPLGGTAGIAYVEAHRNSATSGGYSHFVYSPAIPGRRITIFREIWQGSTRFSATSGTSFDETANNFTIRSSGGIILPAGPFEFVVLVEERTLAGALLATDRKSVFVQ